jgi:hypothetical protein
MGKMRTVELQTSQGQSLSKDMTNLEWALQFVKLKIQEMVNTVFGSFLFPHQSTRYLMVAKQTNVGLLFLAQTVFSS